MSVEVNICEHSERTFAHYSCNGCDIDHPVVIFNGGDENEVALIFSNLKFLEEFAREILFKISELEVHRKESIRVKKDQDL